MCARVQICMYTYVHIHTYAYLFVYVWIPTDRSIYLYVHHSITTSFDHYIIMALYHHIVSLSLSLSPHMHMFDVVIIWSRCLSAQALVKFSEALCILAGVQIEFDECVVNVGDVKLDLDELYQNIIESRYKSASKY